MALLRAKIQPTEEEKRYITLQHLEAGYMSGSRTLITPVDTYGLTTLSGEQFTYKEPVETYVIFDERPKPFLLQKLGWFRENAEQIPILAYIPTHLLYDKVSGEVINEVILRGNETRQLVETGESEDYILQELKITRGAILDVFYDFAPDKLNKFYVADVKTDLVSINYIANLVPYKYDADKEAEEDQNTSNGEYLDFNSDEYGI